MTQPPKAVITGAMIAAEHSACRSQRGAAIFHADGRAVAFGHNQKPKGEPCYGSETCKLTCRAEAIHAEQAALLLAGLSANGGDLLHVKVVGGNLVASGEPNCLECSKLMMFAGIRAVWLLHVDGWRQYLIREFHRETLVSVGRRPWKPMESAPRNGREVLLRVKMRAGIPNCQLVGHYMRGGHSIQDHPAIDGGWYFWNGRMFDLAAEPIEWMDLPE